RGRSSRGGRAGLSHLVAVLARGATGAYAAVRHLLIGEPELGLACRTLYDHDRSFSLVWRPADKELSEEIRRCPAFLAHVVAYGEMPPYALRHSTTRLGKDRSFQHE